MFDPPRAVAIGLLTQRDLTNLGANFQAAFPVEAEPPFDDLIDAIDEAILNRQRTVVREELEGAAGPPGTSMSELLISYLQERVDACSALAADAPDDIAKRLYLRTRALRGGAAKGPRG